MAFAVDPLYHQMSGQFDEGGAKGLLLSNLGTYSGCHILFDSFEVPGKSMAYETQNDTSELVDLSFVKESIEQMLTHMPVKNDISPTLMDIMNQFDEKNHGPSFSSLSTEETVFQVGVADNDHTNFECDANDYNEWSFDHDDHTHSSVIDDHNLQENDDYIFKGSDIDDGLGKVADLFSVGFQLTSNSNAWAGPDHWKYQKTRGLDKTAVSVNGSELEIKVKNRKKDLPDICFTQSLDKTLDIFSCPKNPRSLLLPVNRYLCNTTLPEDCHYNPENLLRLFVLPNCMFLGKKGRKSSDETRQPNHTCHPLALSDSGSMISDPLNDGDDFSDGYDPGSLVHQPRQVNKVDIQYERVSKQVDVHALKEMLWSDIQNSVQIPEKGHDTRISFKQILHHLYNEQTEVFVQDISPHLFFICLLHLANEHGLMIADFPSLDELDIHIPFSALVK